MADTPPDILGSVHRVDAGAVSPAVPNDAAEYIPQVYTELRALAGAFMRDWRPGHTLQPTALVHEAYVRLAANSNLNANSEAHFFAIAAKAMRAVLVDHSRAAGAHKRGGQAQRVTLSGIGVIDASTAHDFVEIDNAVTALARVSPRQAAVVEMRFFGGLAVEQVAVVLGVSARTVELDWRFARAWLRNRLEGGTG